MKTQSNNVPS